MLPEIDNISDNAFFIFHVIYYFAIFFATFIRTVMLYLFDDFIKISIR